MAFPSDYTKYQEVTIDATKVTADQTDFVVYVDLAELVKAGADIFDTCRTDGGDIRATKTDGTTELPIEIVTIDTTGKTGEVHIKFTGTLSSSTDTVIRIWYNGADTVPSVSSTYGRNNVWSDYVAVHHMQEASGTRVDSTGNGNNLSSSGLDANIDGKLGKAVDLETDNNSYLSAGNVARVNASGFTLSAWMNKESNVFGYLAQRGAGDSDLNYRIEIGATSGGGFYRKVGSNMRNATHSQSWSTGVDYMIQATQGSNGGKLYRNKTQIASDGFTGNISGGDNGNYVVGARDRGSGATNHFDGWIDEFRIKASEDSVSRMNTEYENQNAPATFSSAGDEEGSSGTDYPITASVGAFTLTGVITALQIGLQLIASVGTFALTGIATGFKFGKTLIANTGTFVLTGIEAVLIAGGRLSAEVGTFVLTGIDATLAIPRRFLAEVGEFTLTGIDINFRSGKAMIASVGTFALTGFDALFGLGKGMMTSVGNFTLTGFTVTFVWVKRITAGVGSFILTGINAILRPSNIWSNPSDKNNADWVNKDKS